MQLWCSGLCLATLSMQSVSLFECARPNEIDHMKCVYISCRLQTADLSLHCCNDSARSIDCDSQPCQVILHHIQNVCSLYILLCTAAHYEFISRSVGDKEIVLTEKKATVICSIFLLVSASLRVHLVCVCVHCCCCCCCLWLIVGLANALAAGRARSAPVELVDIDF